MQLRNIPGWGIAIALAAVASAGDADRVRTYEIAIDFGSPVPSLGEGFNLLGGEYGPRINNHGRIAFSGAVDGPGVVSLPPNSQVVMTDSGNPDFEVIARNRDTAPPPLRPFPLEAITGQRMAFADSGDVHFRVSTTANPNLLLRWSPGDQQSSVVLASDSPAPAFDGAELTEIVTSWTNPAGSALVWARVVGPPESSVGGDVIYAETPSGELIPRIKGFGPIPGVPDKIATGLTAIANKAGSVAGVVRYGSTGSGQVLLMEQADSSISPALRTGQAAEWFHPSATVRSFGIGRQAMHAGSEDVGVVVGFAMPGDDDAGAVVAAVNRDGTARIAATLGEAPAGFEPYEAFTSFFRSVINVSDSGDTVFTADISTETRSVQGLFRSSLDGTLERIAQEGQIAPGLSGDLTFRDIDELSLQVNAAGQVVFGATTSDQEEGFWACDSDGSVLLLVRVGMTIDVDPSRAAEDLRTIQNFSPYFDLNDRGQFAMHVYFDDGTGGVLVAQIPAPPSAIMGLGSAALCLTRRKRERY